MSKKKFDFEKIVLEVASMGSTGVILLIVMASTGLAGAAAITTALSILGGPFGMLGGIGTLLIINKLLSKYGFEKLFKMILDKNLENGKTKIELWEDIQKNKLFKKLPLKLQNKIKKHLTDDLVEVYKDQDIIEHNNCKSSPKTR